MEAGPSILVLQTQCDLSLLDVLWAQSGRRSEGTLLETTASQKWHETLSESPLTCDILMLPLLQEVPDEGSRGMDASENDPRHGVAAFPRQTLFPCGSDNLLSIEQRMSGNYLLSASDCVLWLEQETSGSMIPLQLALDKENSQQHVQWSDAQEEFETVVLNLTLSLPLDESIQEYIQIQQNSTYEEWLSEPPESEEPTVDSGPPASSEELNREFSNPSCQVLEEENGSDTGRQLPSENQGRTLCCRELHLLELQVQRELNSIHMITNLMVLVPSLALLVVGMWLFLDRHGGVRSQPPSGRRSKGTSHSAPVKIVSVPAPTPTPPPSPSPPPLNTNRQTSSPAVPSAPETDNRETHEIPTLSRTKHTDDLSRCCVSSLPPSSPKDRNKSVPNDNVPSPRTLLTLQWEEKRLRKEQSNQSKSTSHSLSRDSLDRQSLTPCPPRAVVTPDSTPRSRSYLECATNEKENDPSTQRQRQPLFKSRTDVNPSIAPMVRKPNAVVQPPTTNFQNDYWA